MTTAAQWMILVPEAVDLVSAKRCVSLHRHMIADVNTLYNIAQHFVSLC
jgi:hypothetical protein